VSANASAGAGLCAACSHSRRIVSARGSEFWLCQRAESDAAGFERYPRLPVRQCSGFARSQD
jgi:hypothetical protein